jgi:hypothetical protein
MIERIASIKSKRRNVFNDMIGFKNKSPTRTIAGAEKITIGFQKIIESGNRSGRVTIEMAKSRITPRDV